MLKTEINELHSVLDWVRWGATRFAQEQIFFGHGTDNAWDEAFVLVMSVIEQPWDVYEKVKTARLTIAEREKIFDLYERRINERLPSAYLTGTGWFAGFPFKVNQDVLVPRSPIAELILKGFEPWLTEPPGRILDLCTGSGCIGIACAHQFFNAEVVLSDISESALVVAEKNIGFHKVKDRVTTCLSDGFAALDGQKFDLLVSNPPYVDAGDLASMPAEFQSEPSIGLASGEDGLNFTRGILKHAAEVLNPGGLLVVEVGNSCEALEQAYPHISFLWPEFEYGGHGVFVLTREQLLQAE